MRLFDFQLTHELTTRSPFWHCKHYDCLQIAAASLGFLIIVLLHSKLNAEDNPHAILFRGFMMMTMFLIGVVPSVHHAYACRSCSGCGDCDRCCDALLLARTVVAIVVAVPCWLRTLRSRPDCQNPPTLGHLRGEIYLQTPPRFAPSLSLVPGVRINPPPLPPIF